MKPPGFLFFSDAEGEFRSEADHSLLVRGSVGIVGKYGGREAFFGPVVSGYKVVVDKVSRCSGVKECTGVGDFSQGTMVEGNGEFDGFGSSTGYKDLSNVGRGRRSFFPG